MSVARPRDTLVAAGLTFRFDEQDRTAAPMAAGLSPGAIARGRAAARREVQEWLSQWATWLDRDREPALSAVDAWNAEPILRTALKLQMPDATWSAPWLNSSAMPAIPGRAAKALGTAWLPLLIRRRMRGAVSRYQRKHVQWLAGQRSAWQAIRDKAIEARELDRQFGDACAALRTSIDDGTGQAPAAAALRTILRGLSPQLHLVNLQFEGTDVLLLRCQYGGDVVIENRRYQSKDDGSGLYEQEGEGVARQRLLALGHLLALSIADLLRLLATSRRRIDLSLHVTDSALRAFWVRFDATPELPWAPDIVATVRARETPSIFEWTYEPLPAAESGP